MSNVGDWIKEHHVFFRWWKDHRHSGFCEDSEGRAHWTIEPWAAYECNRYRSEFSADTGSPYSTPLVPSVNGSPLDYNSEEIESWAKDQQAAVDSGRVPTREEFVKEAKDAVAMLARKFAEERAKAA